MLLYAIFRAHDDARYYYTHILYRRRQWAEKYNNIRIVDNIHTYSTAFMRVHTNDIILYRRVIKTKKKKICRNEPAAYNSNNDYKRN